MTDEQKSAFLELEKINSSLEKRVQELEDELKLCKNTNDVWQDLWSSDTDLLTFFVNLFQKANKSKRYYKKLYLEELDKSKGLNKLPDVNTMEPNSITKTTVSRFFELSNSHERIFQVVATNPSFLFQEVDFSSESLEEVMKSEYRTESELLSQGYSFNED